MSFKLGERDGADKALAILRQIEERQNKQYPYSEWQNTNEQVENNSGGCLKWGILVPLIPVVLHTISKII